MKGVKSRETRVATILYNKDSRKFRVVEKAGGVMLERLYLVAQNIDHLKGRYFVSAIVIAGNEKQAIDRVCDYLSEYEGVLFDEERVKAMEIGVLTERPNPKGLGVNMQHLSNTELLALEIGEDFDF